MSEWAVQTIESFELVRRSQKTPCFLCDHENFLAESFCEKCGVPTFLGTREEADLPAPQVLAVLGPPGCGKSVYLSVLTDLLARRVSAFHLLARGAFSVALQEVCLSALAENRFPPPTGVEPEHWNWVHCQIQGERHSKRELLIPDVSGHAFAAEVEGQVSDSVIQPIVARSEAAIILIDCVALQSASETQDFWGMKAIRYLQMCQQAEIPVSLLFAKADRDEACLEAPDAFAQERTPGLWRLCQELPTSRFFAASSVGSTCTIKDGDQTIEAPLRIEPRNVEEPFDWLMSCL